MSSRLFRIGGVAAAAVLALTACSSGDSTPATTTGGVTTVKAGTLTVCSDIPYKPFEVEDSSAPSGYSGFDIEVVGQIATNLGLKLSVQDVSFDALQSGAVLIAGQCDMGASAITITDERKANLDFSAPYYDSLQSLLVKTSSGITGIDGLAGKKVAVQQGTTGKTYAEQNAPKSASLVEYPSDGEMWPAIQAGQVDAILQDLPVNIEHVKADPSYSIVGKYDTKEQYGFAVAKDKNPALLTAINSALTTMRSDGSYQKLYTKYFGS